MTLQEQYASHQANEQNRIRAMSSLVAYVNTMLSRHTAEVAIDEVSENHFTLRRVVDEETRIARVAYTAEGWKLRDAYAISGHQDIAAVWFYIKKVLNIDPPPKAPAGEDTPTEG